MPKRAGSSRLLHGLGVFPVLKSMASRRRLILGLLVPAVVMVTARLPADVADDQYAVAAGHYAQRRWKLAVEEFRDFLEQYPHHPRAGQSVFYLAEALLQAGQTEQAGSRFREYLNRKPEGELARTALFRAAETAYLGGKTDLAKAELRQFRSKYPDDPLNAYVLAYLGDVCLGQGETAAAIGHFRTALGRFPEGRLQDDCRFGLARALERETRNQEAERLYRTVAEKRGSPLADDARFHLGALQYAMGRHAEAIASFAAFEEELADSPWRANACLGWGWALVQLDRPKEAQRVFERIVDDPKIGIQARYWLGMTQRSQEDWAVAAETLLAAAGADPQHRLTPDIRFYAADALRRSGNRQAAREQYELVMASTVAGNPWADDAMHGKIQAALEAEDYETVDREAAEFETRFAESSLKGDVARMRAQSLLKRKRYGEALGLLEPLVSVGILDAQGMADRYLLARAYEGLRRYEDALAVLLPVLDSSDGRLKADALLTQGSLLLAMQRYGDAVEPLEAFLATGPTGDEAIKGLGELAICNARTGRLDKAKQQYAELLQKHPRHRLMGPIAEQLAEAAYAAEDAQWSAELFNRLEADAGSNEDQLRGLAGVGWSQYKAGRLAEAAATFESLLAKDPPAPMAAEAALARGRILEQLGSADAALVTYDLVIDKYPKTKQHPDALLAAARLRDKLQQDKEAAGLYERLAKEYPEHAEVDAVLYEWAWVLNDLGRQAESDELFGRLRQSHPRSRYRADATYRLAQRAFRVKDYARASELCSEALAEDPEGGIREHALYLRGQIAVAKEDWQQVGESFGALVEEFPENSKRLVADFWVAEASYRRRDYEAAAEKFDRIARPASGHQEAWLAMVPLRRAQILAHRKRWNEAYAIASKIETDYPKFDQQYEADYLIGRCLSARADLQGAREAYRRVIRRPTGAKTETAAMAQWMIAETFFHQDDYESALRQYLRVNLLYAYPTWQAASLLQAGKCRELLGEHGEAARLFGQLLKEYPGTRFAEEAGQRLRALPDRQAGQPKTD